MSISLHDATSFINEVISTLKKVGEKEGKQCDAYDMPPLRGSTIKEIARTLPMKYARALKLVVTADNQVTFLAASRQVLRFTVLENLSDQALKDIDTCEKNMSEKDLARLRKLERRSTLDLAGSDVSANIAAMKLQQKFRKTRQMDDTDGTTNKAAPKEPSGKAQSREQQQGTGSGLEASVRVDNSRNDVPSDALRVAAVAELEVEIADCTPPRAG